MLRNGNGLVHILFRVAFVFSMLFTLVFVTQVDLIFACSTMFTGGPPNVPPPCCECEGDCKRSPNYVRTGNYEARFTDLQIPTRGFSLEIIRNYHGMRAIDGLFGIGWTSNITSRITYSTNKFEPPSTYYNEAAILMPDGKILRYRQNTDGTFAPPIESKHILIKNGDGTYDLFLKLSRSYYHYSASGALLSMTDDYGNSVNISYDGNNRPQQISDATGSGRYINITYGSNGRVSSLQDSSSRTVLYDYETSGALSEVTDAEGRTTTYSYVTGRYGPILSQIRDPWNRVITSITYDQFDRTLTYTAAGETWTYIYDYQGNPNKTAKKNSANNTWIYQHDSAGLVTSNEPPVGSDSATTVTIYNPDYSINTQSDAVGIVMTYTYNPNGSVASIKRNHYGWQGVRFDYTYDPTFPEKVISIIPKIPSNGVYDSDWQGWKYDYYPIGSTAPGALHHTYRLRNDGVTQDTIATYTYNSFGQVLTATDATGGVTTYNYSATTGDLTSVLYPKNSDAGANPTYVYGRDSIGRVTSVTDPLGKVTTYTYDGIDRITSVTLPKPNIAFPQDFITTYTYDQYDAATSLVFTHQTDPNGRVTKQGYDQFGQMLKSIDALNNTTTFSYNKGLLASITDSNNNTTSYAYNMLRRLITTTFPGGTTETYTYFADGLLKDKKDRKNQTVSYLYDAHKRLTRKTYPGNKQINYTYVGQKMTQVVDGLASPSETHTFSYDSSFRVSTNVQSTRGTLTYTFDPADRIAAYTLTSGPSATNTYYSDGSLKTISWSPIAGQLTYNYTLNGQYSVINMPNGQHRDYTYDDQGRLTQLTNVDPVAGILASFNYGYDIDHASGQNTMMGQRTTMTSASNQTKYFYDGNYQLKRTEYPNVPPFNAEIHQWTYDSIGNRLTNTINSTTQNYTYYLNGSSTNTQKLQSDGTKTYTYDNNGNVISDGTYTFTWDFENRITGITGGGLTASYKYDYLGRRVGKTVNSATTTYIYDGQNLIGERGATIADYVFGPGIDEPLAQSRSGAISYYDVDGLGSVVRTNNPSGTVENSYTSDAWGVLRSQSGSVANPFGYTAREFGEGGLMYYRARYHAAGIGRFVSEDPLDQIRVDSDNTLTSPPYSLALFMYADNDPVLFTDPRGMVKVDPSCRNTKLSGDVADALCLKAAKCFGGRMGSRLELRCAMVTVKCGKITSKRPATAGRPLCGQRDGTTITLNTSMIGNAGCPKTIGCALIHELSHLGILGSSKSRDETERIAEACEEKCCPAGTNSPPGKSEGGGICSC